MKNHFIKILCIILLGILLAGCKKSVSLVSPTIQPTRNAIELVDGLGRTVRLAQPAQRIVSMAPSATEILFSVGAGGQVVGRDSFSNYPEQAKSLQDVGGSMGSYSYEMIASLKPDLVVAAEINTPEQVKALEDLGINVYYFSNPKTLDELYSILETSGTLTGHTPEAATLVASLKTRVQVVVEKTATTSTQPVVFYEIDGSDPAKPWTPGPGAFLDLLINMAGGENVGSALQSDWAQISVEEILVRNPDMILLGDSIYGVSPADVAARDNKVYGFNADLVSRPGPRLVDGLEALSMSIHPELYK
jgi:iron complex transport system substrate-binding protein